MLTRRVLCVTTASEPGDVLRGFGVVLSAIRTAAAEVKRVFLCLLARLRVNRNLAYRYPAIVAGTGALVLMVTFLARWVRVGCARLIHVNLLVRLAGSRGVASPAGPFTLCKGSLPEVSGCV
jgi:hypothetical protein